MMQPHHLDTIVPPASKISVGKQKLRMQVQLRIYITSDIFENFDKIEQALLYVGGCNLKELS